MRSIVWSVLISGIMVPAAVGAADVAGFNGQRFAPAGGIAGGFAVESPFVAPHLGYGLGLFLNFADDAVVTRDPAGDVVQRPLDSALSFDLLGALALFDRFELAVDLPIHAVYVGDPVFVSGEIVSPNAGIGDLRLVPKVALTRAGSRFGVGLAIPVTLPTGTAARLRGDGVLTAEPKLLLGLRTRRVGLTLNGGLRLRPGRQPLGQEVTFGGAARLAVLPQRDLVDLTVEATGGAFLSPDLNALARYPVELIAGVVVKPNPSWQLYLGAGPGLTGGVGAANYRVLTGIRFAPRPADSGYADGDGDGIPDFADRCPTQREDEDGFQDDDGCPDPDNDADGVSDEVDECPQEPGAPPDGCPSGEVTYREGRILIRGKIQFEVGSAKLKSSSGGLIDGVAQVLREHPEIHLVRVDGHTDGAGPADANQKLSEHRSGSVLEALVKRGVDPERLSRRGFGESKPIAPNATNAGRSRNRRVEFTIIK